MVENSHEFKTGFLNVYVQLAHVMAKPTAVIQLMEPAFVVQEELLANPVIGG